MYRQIDIIELENCYRSAVDNLTESSSCKSTLPCTMYDNVEVAIARAAWYERRRRDDLTVSRIHSSPTCQPGCVLPGTLVRRLIKVRENAPTPTPFLKYEDINSPAPAKWSFTVLSGNKRVPTRGKWFTYFWQSFSVNPLGMYFSIDFRKSQNNLFLPFNFNFLRIFFNQMSICRFESVENCWCLVKKKKKERRFSCTLFASN